MRIRTDKDHNSDIPQVNSLNDLCRYFPGIPSYNQKKSDGNGCLIPFMVLILIFFAFFSFVAAQPVPVTQVQDPVIQETETQVESVSECQIYYSTAELNIRSGPGTDYAIIDTIPFGEKVEVIDFEEGWAKLKSYGEEAYASADYLSKSQPETTSEDEGPMVWVSYSGNKYHSNPSCSGMKGARQVTLRSAQMAGKTPCLKCY